jgi:uncharacterized protein with gpF-like domain
MAKDYQYLFSQLRRIEDHREQQAEKEIRKLYRKILKETRQFVAEEYYQLAEDGKLTFEILRSKSMDARFLQEVEERLGDLSIDVSREIKRTVEEMYQLSYDGLRNAVEKGKDSKELQAFFQGVDTATAQTAWASVDNTIMDVALEKNHKNIIWDIKREVATALTVGDRFDTMADRIAGKLNGNYKKAILIARTEVGRVREAGHLASAKNLNDALQEGSSGMRMVKKWMTMRDGSVRDTHSRMNGVIVEMDDAFELPSGVKTMAPKQSGVASEDCNCRCYVSYQLMDDEEFFRATGKHFKTMGQSSGDEASSTVDSANVVGQVDFSREDLVINKINTAQREFADLKHEENITITTDGRIWHIKGKAGSVNPWSVNESGGNLVGAYSYHNHPAGKTWYSFSKEDVRYFLAAKQAYSKAADDVYEYVMRRTKNTIDVDPEAAYNRFKEIYSTTVSELAWDEKIDMDLDGYHETMKILSKEFKFLYERRKLNGGK